MDHWRGRQGLAWSFWVNFVALRLVLFAAQEGATAALATKPLPPVWLIVVWVAVFHLALFVWQAIGVLRAAERHLGGSGQMSRLWGVQLMLGLAAFWSLSYSLEAWLLTRPEINPVPSQAQLQDERARKYSIGLTPDGRALHLEGSIELGVTARLRDFLDPRLRERIG